MKETIAFKISQKDYFKFSIVNHTKLTGYYGIIIFILTLLERDKTYSLPVGIIIAFLFSAIFMFALWIIFSVFSYFRSKKIYKQDKILSIEVELTFTDDYFEETNERGYIRYYYRAPLKTPLKKK